MADLDSSGFERLYKVIVVMAAAAVRDAPETFDMGVSPQDLTHETLCAFLESPNRLGWKESQGPVEKFLAAVLYNKARSHLRRDKKIGGSLDDEDRVWPLPDGKQDLAAEVQFRDLQGKLLSAVAGDKDLEELIEAADLTTGAYRINQELADILGKSVPEVVNLKRRLMRNQRVLEILVAYGKRQAV